MDFDAVGNTQSTIEANFTTVNRRCEEMFKKWLGGEGSRQPATWSMLLKILEECKLKALAGDIRTALK